MNQIPVLDPVFRVYSTVVIGYKKTNIVVWGIRLKSFGCLFLICLLFFGFNIPGHAQDRVAGWGYYWYVNGGPNQYLPVGAPPVSLTNAVAVAGGAGHSLALRNDGTVVGWGDNTYGRTRIPTGLTNVQSIAAGSWNSFAVKSDGTVIAWGAGMTVNPNDPYGLQVGQSIVPVGLTNAVSVASGFYHSLALRDDGTVIAWGENNVHQTNVPPGLSNVVAIASGENHCLALKADGTVVSWGHYFASRATHVPPGLTNVVAIAAGSDSHHSLALKADGTLVAWGEDNFYGLMDVPPELTNVAAVAVGGVHNLALKTSGEVVAWGGGKVIDRNTGGDWGQSIVPASLTNATAVGAGYFHSLAIAGDHSPFITAPLVDRTVLAGTKTWFHVAASGSGPLQYQWRFNGDNLPDATKALLELADVQFDRAGVYSVTVSNAFGHAVSRDIKLAVAPLFVTVHPKPQVTLPGRTVSFDVAAIGIEPVRYQWRHNNVDLPGETGQHLVITNVSADDTGDYSVVVENPLGTARSVDANLSLARIASWGIGPFGETDVPAGLTDVIAIAGGFTHSLALRRDGTVAAWGGRFSSQTDVPKTLTNVVAIAAGNSHSLALKNDGSVVPWGSVWFIPTNLPPAVTNVAAISTRNAHDLALRKDGTVVAWGYNSVGQTNVPSDLANVIAIASGGSYSLALKGDGTLIKWGDISETPAPPKPWEPRPVPTELLTNIVAIAAGQDHYLALKADGSVVANGSNQYGQTDVPAAATNVVAIAAGEYFSLALTTGGRIIGWGVETSAGVGLPPPDGNSPQPGPAIVPADVTNVTAIAAGWHHGLALLAAGPPVITSPLIDRTVTFGSTARLYVAAIGALPISYQWRFNGADLEGATNSILEIDRVPFDAIGSYSVVVRNQMGETTSTNVRLQVAPFFITTQPQDQNVHRGATVSLSVTASGQEPFSYQWRRDGVELPGKTSRSLVMSDVHVEDSGAYSAEVRNPAGNVISRTAAVSVGRVVAWGGSNFGQTNLPANLSEVAAIAAGEFHSLALKADGTVVAWGQNVIAGVTLGQTNVPSGLSNVVAIAAGSRHCLALKGDGTMVTWGQDTDGSLKIPMSPGKVAAIAAGAGFSLALRTNGTVLAWGYNEFGQASVPRGLGKVMAIAAGTGHCIALLGDGTVRVWGDNSWGSIQPPPGLSNVVAIASGYQHCAALKSDGTVVAWGATYAGQTAIPATMTDVIAISAGGHHTMALKRDGTLVAGGEMSGRLVPVPLPGTRIVAIASGAGHDLVILDSASPIAATTWSPSASIGGIYFRQTGLMEQIVRVFNRSALAFEAVRVGVHGLQPNARVFNATGTNDAGEPYLEYDRPLAPGAFVDLTIEYFVPDRSIPSGTLTFEAVEPPPPFDPAGTVQEIIRSLRLADGSFLIDFATSAGRTYYLQYSADLNDWRTARPPVSGSGGGMQWVDNGPPKTESHPSTQPNRFYRVLLTP